jgi:hypothetical protein
VTALLGALLVGLDLLRPYVGPPLRPLQWLAGLVALAWLYGRLRRAHPAISSWLPKLALAALLLPVYVDHSRSIDADGVHYYAYLRSLLFDRDLDLRNDYALLEHNTDHKNVLPVGAPLLWSPLLAPLTLVAQAARLFGAPAPSGVEPLFQAAVALANFAYVTAGLYVLMATLRRFAPPAAAFWATVLAWVGSPLRFYLSVLPSFAHGTEFFAAALVLRAALWLRDAPSERRRALAAGAACGLVFLVRSQDGLLLGLPLLFLAAMLREPASRPLVARAALALLGAFALVSLPQLAVWQAMYGTPFLIPHKLLHGDEFLHLDRPELAGTLLSPRGGLFVNYPAQLFACLGLLLLAWRDPLYVAAAVPVLAAGWYVNSTIFDWYQVRRFTGVVPLLAPGLAVLIAPLTRAGTWPAALLAFAVWRYDLALDALRELPGQPAPVRAIVQRAADGLAQDAYALLERRFPGASVALLSAYTGEELLREPVSRIDLGKESGLLRLPRPARNLSAVSAEDGVACRWVQGDVQATLFLPLAHAGEMFVTLTVHPLETSQPMNMEVLLNETRLGSQELSEGWRDYRFAAPAGVARRGTNALVVRFDRAPIYHRVRGSGPRQVRPAALAAITLHRGEPGS